MYRIALDMWVCIYGECANGIFGIFADILSGKLAKDELENHSCLLGTITSFDWAIFNSYVKLQGSMDIYIYIYYMG